MDKKTLKKLERIAENLPILKRIHGRAVLGQKFINDGITELKDGTKIKAKKHYLIPQEEVSKNYHVQQMIALLQKGASDKDLDLYKKAVQVDYQRGL